VEPAKPSLDLVRSVTDEHVLRALMRHRRLTRAELAAETGISKPTAGESVRRLTERGLVVDTGERTPGGRGRGRVGSYYALSADLGAALAVSIAPEGVVAESLDVYGGTIARGRLDIDRPARPKQVAAALRTVAAEVARATGAPPRLAVVSAADPVDRATGRLVQLPDAPFLVGDLDAVAILAPRLGGPVIVTVRYTVADDNVTDFIRAMDAVGRVRRRTGAVTWDLFRDGADPKRFVELFAVPSWDEHLRQHGGRLTGADRAIVERARAFTEAAPEIEHLLPADTPAVEKTHRRSS